MNFALPSLLLSSLLIGQATTTETANPERIQEAIRLLSSADFSERQVATELLWHAGPSAESALRQAAKSADREVAFRAQQVLDKFKFGIFADTPPEIVRLIHQYREGDLKVRSEVLNQLQKQGQIDTMLVLLDAEVDHGMRERLIAEVLREVEKIAPALILAHRYQRVEQLLSRGATTDEGMTLYLTFMVLRGQAAAKIAELRNQHRQGESDPASLRMLAHLLRATGDLTAAKQATEEASDESLLRAVLFDLGDWRRLAELEDVANEVAALSTYALIEKLGFIAAYYRLAGDDVKFQAALDKIRAAGDNEALQWHVAESLLINDQFTEGIDGMKRASPVTAFRLLAEQARFREAFELAEVGQTTEDRDGWFAQMTLDTQSSDKELRQRFELGVQVARALARVGLQDDAKRYFAALGEAVRQDEDGHKQRLQTLIGVERKSGFRDLAREHTASALAAIDNTYPLSALFPEHAEQASSWWELLKQEFPSENRVETLRRIDRLIYGVGDKLSLDELNSLAASADRYGATLESAKRGALLLEIANAFLRHGHLEAGELRLATAAESTPAAAMKLGDLAVERSQWQQAIDWYGRAWQQDQTQYLAYYLQGRAMQQTDAVEAGERQCEVAELLPLRPQARSAFAQGLHSHGFKSEAIEQWRLIVRTGDLHDWYTNDAAKQLGNTVSAKEPLRAADGWQRLLLSALKNNSQFTEAEGYLQLPSLIHKVRARTLLDEGQPAAALVELQAAHAASPGSIKLAEDLFGKFDKAGMNEAVNALFAQTYALYEQLVQDYPQVATHHNNLAWLSAQCDRRLDDALVHATKAVALAPDSTAYLDTLAEVHFRRGNAEEAIRLEQQCLEREPENSIYLEQLKRFRGETATESETDKES